MYESNWIEDHLIPENIQTGGVEDMEFAGVLKKSLCEISIGLGFWPWNFQWVSQNLQEWEVFWNYKCDFSKNSRGGFSEKYISSTPLQFGFFVE